MSKSHFKPILFKQNRVLTGIRQFNILIKHFLLRFFTNDILKFEEYRTESIITILSLLSVIGGYIAHQLLFRYYLAALHRLTADDIWLEKTYFMVITMVVSGVISIINWNRIYFDKKDLSNFSPLPISLITMYSAKSISILIYTIIISLSFNVFAIFVFTLYLERFININPFYFGFTHLFSNFAANLFIFLFVAASEGVLMLLFNKRWFRRISLFIQSLFIFVFVSTIVWFPKIYPELKSIKEKSSVFIYSFPPLWFVGIYEKMTGNKDYVFSILSNIGFLALSICICIYILASSNFLKRFSHISFNKKISKVRNHRWSYLKKKFLSILFRNQVERGIFYFFISTFRHDRKSKLYMSLLLAMPFSYFVTNFFFLSTKKETWTLPSVPPILVSFLLVMIFSFIIGIRTIILQPVKLDANWLFRITENEEKKYYLRSVKKAVLILGAVPFSLLYCLLILSIWKPLPVLLLFIYILIISILLVETVFVNYRKIPFTCEYLPGKARLKTRWPIYILGFSVYVYSFSNLGVFLLQTPRYFFAFFVISGMVYFLLMKLRLKYKKLDIIFEEHIEEEMLSFGQY